MSSVQPSLEHLSLILSEVLDDIGLNDEIVEKRRTHALFQESVGIIYNHIDTNGIISRVYMFGSQSEGTTTIGINSDDDFLFSKTGFNVINDWSYWKHGEENLLMVQDETTAPGYCILQLLRKDAPLAAEYIPNNNFCIDSKGRVLIKNTVFNGTIPDSTQHGPAMMPNNKQFRESDTVASFHCAQWPVEARRWLLKRNVGGWPNASLKSQCEKSGCFLVPIDSKISGLVGIEWRISTTLAERHLMFSLNNIHMKCYTMVKILLKSYVEFKDVISSYMCKTALLHCAENTVADFWQEQNLITCLVKVMCVLYNFILHVKCPHFIIPENNLMAGKISPIQQQRLLVVLEHIIRSEGRMFIQGIKIDHIGERFKQKINRFHIHFPQLNSRLEIHGYVSGELAIFSMCTLIKAHITFLFTYRNQSNAFTMKQIVCKYKEICNLYPQLNNLQKKAASHILSLMCSTIGTQMACHNVSLQGRITDKSIEWLKLGLNSDASSGLLKLATVYYSNGDMRVTEEILTRIDQRFDRNVVHQVCGCNIDRFFTSKEGFDQAANESQVTDTRRIVSYCVSFMYNEVNIVPQELIQEFFRSTREEIQRRDQILDRWMDLAAVDSLPYLYFLQYKVYSTLQKIEEKQIALNKLKHVFNEEPCLYHKETVYNLIGQCMEQENLPDEAFHYYERSIQERSQHNAANIHRSRLLSI